MNDLELTFALPHPNPLVELLAIRLSPQAGKSLVIPQGEGASATLRVLIGLLQ
jgi:hypothetical protein